MTSNNFFSEHHVGDRLSEEDLKVIEKMLKFEIETRFEIRYKDGTDDRYLTLLNDRNLKTTEYYYSPTINGDVDEMYKNLKDAVADRDWSLWDRIHGGTRLCLIIHSLKYYVKMCEATTFEGGRKVSYISVVFHPNGY